MSDTDIIQEKLLFVKPLLLSGKAATHGLRLRVKYKYSTLQVTFLTHPGRGHRETLLHDAAATDEGHNIPRHVLQAMCSWRVYDFHDTRETARIKDLVNVHDNKELRHDASNLAAYLYLLRERHQDTYDRIVSTVRLVAPFFDAFTLEPSRLNPEKIRLE